MKVQLYSIFLAVVLFTNPPVFSQGSFVYDQESSTDEVVAGNTVIQQSQPFAQSFIPTLPTMNFVRLKLSDNDPSSGAGATLYVNLFASSMTGAVLSSTQPITLSNAFAGTVIFFPTSINLSPGQIYLFQPIVQSGDLWNIDVEAFRGV